jgi:hypothetical protein
MAFVDNETEKEWTLFAKLSALQQKSRLLGEAARGVASGVNLVATPIGWGCGGRTGLDESGITSRLRRY